ncbi:hypothetical protein SEPCBS119000_002862 [Sporothrix epigloea]|uniref:Uncharacterized protein n=1 Tax=Sporothrix epigloea TaxID=1892477 RepID=A0ABP0DII3_9PEZI
MPDGVLPIGTADCDSTDTSANPAAIVGAGHRAGLDLITGIQTPSLPKDRNDEVEWRTHEENWLQQIAIARAKEDRDIVLEYDAEETMLHAELDEAICEHNRLTEKLLQARVLVDEKKADIEWLVDAYQRRRKAVEARRAADDLRVRAWINKGRHVIDISKHQITSRGSGPLPIIYSLSNEGTTANGQVLDPVDQYRHDMGLGAATPPLTAAQSAAASPRLGTSSHHTPAELYSSLSAERHVSVVNSDGDAIGVVARIVPDNHWIQALLDRPVVRAVEIRRGRKFTSTHLDTIYEKHDQKMSKWLSFMIQATGEIQGHACQTCAKGQGLFSICVIVGGSEFPRCGNCEWNKQGCHGAYGRTANRVSAATFLSVRQEEHAHSRPDQYHGGADQMTSTADTLSRHVAHADVINEPPSHGSQLLIDRVSPNRSGRADWAKQSNTTGTPQQAETSMMRQLSPPIDKANDGEITLAMISSKDDGVIFLEPDLMYGVPLRKITPDHAYWEPSWKPIEGAVQSKLEEWMEKLAKLKALPEASLMEKERTAVFQAGRQVNRGKATMRYLATCDFHPYQLVAKKWITPALTHYDTLFRMVATLEELAKFRLDVTPLQWLRQRLYELYCERMSTFKLDRAIAKLYHDPKLAHLRSKNGFGNIGRPSASKRPRVSEANGLDQEKGSASEKRKGTANGNTSTPKKQRSAAANKQTDKDGVMRPARKTVPRSASTATASTAPTTTNRRSGRSTSSTSRDTKSQTAATSLTHISSTASGSPKSSQAALHSADYVTGTATEIATDSDLEYSGYTTSDSLTHDTVVRKDWRVYQVKTKSLATNPQTTQYWHWVDKRQAHRSESEDQRDFDCMFEHQVLKETEPVTGWGVFADPVDFHLRLRELTEVAFSPESDIIVIGTRELEGVVSRGDIFARFKRERTKRRFLAFLRKKGVPLRRTERQVIEDEWYGINAEVMAGNESE